MVTMVTRSVGLSSNRVYLVKEASPARIVIAKLMISFMSLDPLFEGSPVYGVKAP